MRECNGMYGMKAEVDYLGKNRSSKRLGKDSCIANKDTYDLHV